MKLKLFYLGVVCAVAFAGFACSRDTERNASEILQSAVANAETDWKKTLEDAKEAYAKEPGDTSVQVMYALALDNTGNPDEALKISTIAAGNEKSFVAQYLYGRFLFRNGDYNRAFFALKKAHELNPTDEDVLLLLLRVSATLNNDETLAFCDELERLYIANKTFTNEKKAFLANEKGIYYTLRHAEAFKRPKDGKNFSGATWAKLFFGIAAKTMPNSPEICLNQAIVSDYYLSKAERKGSKAERDREKRRADKERNNAVTLYRKYLSLIEGDNFNYELERTAVKQRLESFR